MAIGKQIKSLRTKRGLSQQKLAEKAQISLAVLQKLEQGTHSNPSLSTLTSIAKVLQVSIDSLIK